jgi:hypothetical protein
MEHRYVRIEAAKPSSPQGPSPLANGTARIPPRRRRTGITLACDACRRKKIRVRSQHHTAMHCTSQASLCLARASSVHPRLFHPTNTIDYSVRAASRPVLLAPELPFPVTTPRRVLSKRRMPEMPLLFRCCARCPVPKPSDYSRRSE